MEDVEPFLSLAREAFGNEPDAVNLWIGDDRSVSAVHKDHYEVRIALGGAVCREEGKNRLVGLVGSGRESPLRPWLCWGRFVGDAGGSGHRVRVRVRIVATACRWLSILWFR